MANFTGQTVTNAGRNLLGRVLAGEGKLVFTKAAFGDQKHSDDLRAVRDLKHKKLDLKVMNIRNDSGTAVLTVYMSNENVEEGFRTEEFGVYAKIDTDDEEILYSYCVAIEADFFPNNRLGHTYENVTDVYMAIANDVDADIHVQDGVVFLTKRIADENYIKYGVQAVGELEGRTSLEENKRYSSKGEWYLNIGGNRSWDKSSTPDENLIHMTWDWLFKNKEPIFKKKSGFNLEKTDSYEEDDTNKVATGRALKSLYDWIRNKLASFTLSWDRITNKPNLTTTENLTQLLKGKENTFAKNSGFNKEKTSEYKSDKDAEKLFTQEGANNLYKEVEEDIRNIDLSGKTDKGGYEGSAQDLKDEIDKKQNKTDDSLETKKKTVVGAINELNKGKAKYINLSSQAQTMAYRKTVIALCELRDGIGTSYHSYSAGTITFHRANGLEGASIIRADVSMEDRYGSVESTGKANGSLILSGVDSTLREVKLCTFQYKGKKYGGLHFFVSDAEHSFVEFYGNTNFEIFAVDYMSTRPDIEPLPNGDVEDIKSSLNFTDVASDVNQIYYNGSRILTEKTSCNWETIYSGNLNAGSFTTSKSIWDYTYIQIIGSTDDSTYLWVTEYRITDLKYCLQTWSGQWFMLATGINYWGIRPTELLADGRTFYAHGSENCRLYQVRVR